MLAEQLLGAPQWELCVTNGRLGHFKIVLPVEGDLLGLAGTEHSPGTAQPFPPLSDTLPEDALEGRTMALVRCWGCPFGSKKGEFHGW